MRLRFTLLLVVAAAWACGADNLEAPAPAAVANSPTACRSFGDLMPRFVSALNTGQTEGLRQVVQNYLLVSARPDEPPPAVDVLRVVFGTLSTWAAYPPEPGAASGQVCAQAPAPIPPLEQAHPLCEVRRVLDTLVHQGQGQAALALIDPLLSGALDYLVGKSPSSSTPHYEVAAVISNMCQQSATCQTGDTMDLVIGGAAFLQTDAGTGMINDLNNLVNNPALQPFITNPDGGSNGQQYGGEDGVVALAKVVIQIIQGMKDTSALDALPLSVFPQALQPDIQALIADLKLLLDPNRSPNVLRPLQRTLNCYTVQDTQNDLIRMVYRLAFDAQLPAYTLPSVSGAVKGIRDTDQRGSVIYLVKLFATAIRDDATAPTSLGQVCSTLFSTTATSSASQSNASEALPSVAALFDQGVAGEAICAIDTLVYGCAGGSQPACTGIP